MSKIVMTMPIKPQKETKIGMYIAPTLMNVLSDILSCDSVMAINLLNTYKDKDSELKTFLDDLDRQGIIYNNLFIDKEIKYTGKVLSPHWIYKNFCIFIDKFCIFLKNFR